MWQYNYTDELYHHGVKGQKWGIRHDRSREYNQGYKRGKRERRAANAIATKHSLYRIDKNENWGISRKATESRGDFRKRKRDILGRAMSVANASDRINMHNKKIGKYEARKEKRMAKGKDVSRLSYKLSRGKDAVKRLEKYRSTVISGKNGVSKLTQKQIEMGKARLAAARSMVTFNTYMAGVVGGTATGLVVTAPQRKAEKQYEYRKAIKGR